MVSIRRIIYPFIFLIAIGFADYQQNTIIIKLSPYSGKLQAQAISNIQEIPNNIKELANKFGPNKTNLFGNISQTNAISLSNRQSSLANYLTITFDHDIDIANALKQYQQLPNVESVQPSYIYRAIFTPNDPGITGNQQDSGLKRLYPEAAWDITTGNAAIEIAVLDTGVLSTHQDISSNINTADWKNYTVDPNNPSTDGEDDNGHGTMVAGIIGAVGNNGTGIAGTCWNCKILPLKILDSDGFGTTVGLVNAIEYARTQGVEIINMSLGQTVYDSLLKAACNDAYAANITLVAAMGNTGGPIAKDSVLYPAAYDSVISVGAVDGTQIDLPLAEFSVAGTYPYTTELVAPGVLIASTYINGDYGVGDGTSFAAPFVAGAAALLKSNTASMSNIEIRNRLHKSADDLGRSGKDSRFGYGIINLENALLDNFGTRVTPNEYISDMIVFPNPATKEAVTIMFTAGKIITNTRLTIYDFKGRLLKEIVGASGSIGEYRLDWNLKDSRDMHVNNGSYIYILEINSGSITSTKRGVISITR